MTIKSAKRLGPRLRGGDVSNPDNFLKRLLNKDASLWSPDQAEQKSIRSLLGWLDAPERMALNVGVIKNFVKDVRADGFTEVVILGMGGASLVCETFAGLFPPGQGVPRLHVLDTTNPRQIAEFESASDLKTCFFIAASKSGTTIESDCLLDYFHTRALKLPGPAGRRFAAITDPRTALDKKAASLQFRRVFTNAPDVGGRFSALTFFGLAPAALIGVDIAQILQRALETKRDPSQGLRLGAWLGAHAAKGRDKLRIELAGEFASLGPWLEQLIAESLGKKGKGILPVVGPIEDDDIEAPDSVFVRIGGSQGNRKTPARPRPADPRFFEMTLKDHYDVGAQFLIWELAVATAAAVLGLNPFDQPDVQSAKQRTQEVLNAAGDALDLLGGRAGNMTAFWDQDLDGRLSKDRDAHRHWTLDEILKTHLSRMPARGYATILAFVDPSGDNRRDLEAIRAQIARLTKRPSVLAYGPRYLHSTGQFFKGGPNTGLFLELVETDLRDLAIPRREYGFKALHAAQSQGDFAAMAESGRRILRLDLGPSGEKPLRAVERAIEKAHA